MTGSARDTAPVTTRSDAAAVGPPARSDRNGHVGTKPFERALLRLNSVVGVSMAGPRTTAHPLSVLGSASPSLRVAWGQLHSALHPDWLVRAVRFEP